MIISTMRLANGKIEILYCGITVATCDTEIQSHLVCRALTSASNDDYVKHWAGEVLKEDARRE